MLRRLSAAVVVVTLLVGIVASVGGTPIASAQQAPDEADVVLLMDFSASILNDRANRNRFAQALERIADRVDQISGELQTGDTTVSFVQFASRARDYPGWSQEYDLKGILHEIHDQNADRWSAEGRVDRWLFEKAAEAGILGFAIPEEYGGGGADDFRFHAIMGEELAQNPVSDGMAGIALSNNDSILFTWKDQLT